jgi:hypothetical protein
MAWGRIDPIHAASRIRYVLRNDEYGRRDSVAEQDLKSVLVKPHEAVVEGQSDLPTRQSLAPPELLDPIL